MRSFCNVLGEISGILCAFAVVFALIGHPVFILYCAIFSIINSIFQVIFAGQKGFTMEIASIILGLVAALIFKLNIFNTIIFAICVQDALLQVASWIFLAVQYISFRSRF